MDAEAVKRAVAAIDNFCREYAIVQTYPDQTTVYQLCRMMEQILPGMPEIRKTSSKNLFWKLKVRYLETIGHRMAHADIKPTKETFLLWIKSVDRIGHQYYRKNTGRIESLRSFETSF